MTTRVPVSIIFFPNGRAAVGDADDQQIPDFQGSHAETIRWLAEAGYTWTKLSYIGTPTHMAGCSDPSPRNMTAQRFIRLVHARTRRAMILNEGMTLAMATARSFSQEERLLAGKLERAKGRNRMR